MSQFLIGNSACAKAVNPHRHGLGNTDGIGQLYLNFGSKTGSYQILCHIASHVSAAAVDLSGILAGESTATVGEIAAVGIHNDLSAGQTGIAVGAANDEVSGGIDVNVGDLVDIKAVFFQNRGDYPQANIFTKLSDIKIRAVHDRYNNGVDADYIVVFVKLYCDLSLAVGS